MTNHPTAIDRHAAGLLRTLAAMLYDSFAVIAIWMIATLLILPLTGGEAVTAGNILYQLLLLALAWTYLAWSWLAAGQTLGMRAWRLRLIAFDGTPVNFRKVAVRLPASILSAAAFGLGYAWMLIPPHRLSWHDRLSGTRLVRTSAMPRQKINGD